MSREPFKTAREQGRLAPLKFEHAVLRTGQLRPMVDWYTAVLEAEVSFGNAAVFQNASSANDYTRAITGSYIASGSLVCTVASGHFIRVGMLFRTSGLTTDVITPVAVTATTSTTITLPIAASLNLSVRTGSRTLRMLRFVAEPSNVARTSKEPRRSRRCAHVHGRGWQLHPRGRARHVHVAGGPVGLRVC